MAINKKASTLKREALCDQYWPKARPWTGEKNPWNGEKEVGWFRAPRTLPLILALLRTKALSGRDDPASVYLALLARHLDSGIVDIVNERDLAYESGYSGTRALRTWQERMRLLEKLGFIETKQSGNQKYRYVLIVHPAIPIERLHAEGKVNDAWWNAYTARRIDTKEAFPPAAQAVRDKVVPIGEQKRRRRTSGVS
jgi:hypothetical protein